MKRTDLLKRKGVLWNEIEGLKKQKMSIQNIAESIRIEDKIKKLKKEYQFIRNLLKVSK
jgi:hypothetical protein